MFKALLMCQLKLVLSSMFASKKSVAKKNVAASAGKKVLIAILALYIVACMFFFFGMMLGQICTPLVSAGLDSVYFVMVGLFAFAIMFIGSVFITQKQLYESNDNELLLSMPIPPSRIVIARLMSIFSINLIYGLFVFIPAAVIYFKNTGFSPAALLILIPASVCLILLALALSVFFGWLLAVLTANSRRKNILMPILMLALLLGYLGFYSNLQNVILMLIERGTDVALTVKKFFPPLYFYGEAIGGRSVVMLLLLVAVTAVLLVLMVALVARTFAGITTKSKGTVTKKYSFSEKSVKASSVGKAMLKKELRRFLGSMNYYFNCGLGSLFMLVLAGVIITKGTGLIPTENLPDSFAQSIPSLMHLVAILGLSACALLNNSAAASISLEGSQYSLLRSMPLGFRDIVLPKIMLNFLWGFIPLIPAAIAISVRLRFSVWETILTILVPTVVQLFVALWAMFSNLMFPKLDWVSEVSVIKQGMAIFMSLLGSFGFISVLVVILIALSMLLIDPENVQLDKILPVVAPIVLAYFTIMSGFITLLLATVGKKKFSKIQ